MRPIVAAIQCFPCLPNIQEFPEFSGYFGGRKASSVIPLK